MTTGVKGRTLTPKQERFALLLFQGLSQREAYLRAGYSGNTNPDYIDQMACRVAVKVASRVAELQAYAIDASVSSVLERKQILTTVQRATVADFVDEFGNLDISSKAQLATPAVAEIKTERTLVGIRTTLKLRDPIEAIKEHNKMERIGQDDKPQYNDNRQYNFIVMGDENKQKLQQLLSGEKPKTIEATR